MEQVVTRGRAYFVKRLIRTIKEALIRRISAGIAPRNRWYQLLPDELARYNARTHGGTGVTPNQAYSDPAKAEHADDGCPSEVQRTTSPIAVSG